MRLIDADRLKEVIDRNIAHPDVFKEIVDIQPTAYDVEKVCMRINEAKEMDNLVDGDHAIKIVKAGGING